MTVLSMPRRSALVAASFVVSSSVWRATVASAADTPVAGSTAHDPHVVASALSRIHEHIGNSSSPFAVATSTTTPPPQILGGAGKAGDDIIGEAVDNATQNESDMHLSDPRFKSMCSISPAQQCAMSGLPTDTPSLIFPGGDTACIDGGLYAFRVYPGDPKKLFLHFQGGGACWNEVTTVQHRACKDGLDKHPNEGAFNKSNPENPFYNYTIVMVVYCSGDLHYGNVRRTYGAVQHGHANTMAVLKWTQANMADTLDKLAIGGCSAGSLGSQLWASYLLNTFKYRSASVILDSFVPMFPPGAEASMFKGFGVCEDTSMAEQDVALCKAGNLTVETVLEQAVKAHPNVTFGIINSKADGTQKFFGKIIAMTLALPAYDLDNATYYKHLNELTARLHSYPNVFTFIVGGDLQAAHCYGPSEDRFYKATTAGSLDASYKGTAARDIVARHPTPARWVQTLLERPQEATSDCSGKVVSKKAWDTLNFEQLGTGYCSECSASEVFEGGSEDGKKGGVSGTIGLLGCVLVAGALAAGGAVVLAGSGGRKNRKDKPFLQADDDDEDSGSDSPRSP